MKRNIIFYLFFILTSLIEQFYLISLFILHHSRINPDQIGQHEVTLSEFSNESKIATPITF